jgi:Uma2 family endonuclease
MTTLDYARTAIVDYPESDGSLIAESDWHREELVDLVYRLQRRYAHRPDTYVTGNMLVYYEQGKPSSVFSPDVMVVFGVPRRQRGVYKLWEEERAPSVVFEVSSRKTWREDRDRKRTLCERLGVAEYYLWDVRYEYLTPPLQGFRLEGGVYRALRPDDAGCLESRELGLRLCPGGNRLELHDRDTGERLGRPADAEAAARQAVAEAEAAAREAVAKAEAAARQGVATAEEVARRLVEVERKGRLAAEAEVERLRAALRATDRGSH